MASVAERIKEALEIKGLKPIDLVERTGIGKSSISHYISGKVTPKQRNLYLLAQVLEVSEPWLMGLDAPMDPKLGQLFSSTDWFLPIASAYVSAPASIQEAVCVVLGIPHVVPGAVKTEEVEADTLRITEQAATADSGVYLGPESFRTIQVKSGVLPEEAAYGVPVVGDSLEPHFSDGDILVVSSEKARDGQVGVFTVNGKGRLFMVNGKRVKSLNPENKESHLRERTICNGGVVGVLHRDSIVEGKETT